MFASESPLAPVHTNTRPNTQGAARITLLPIVPLDWKDIYQLIAILRAEFVQRSFPR